MQETEHRRYLPISDYGLIGDCRSAALISRYGSIDWLAWPRFDSPSIFARILDRERGGYFSIRPVETFTTERTYLDDTNVLATTFITDSGRAILTDLMPALPNDFKIEHLSPLRSIIRRVEGLDGSIAFEMTYDPRLDYGRSKVALESRGESVVYCSSRRHSLYLRSNRPIDVSGECARSKFEVAAGQTVDFSLAYSDIAPAVLPLIGIGATREIEATIDYWRSWASAVSYQGRWGRMVRRSALILKLLCFAPSGAVVAAPTTSLPEWIGGERNWDYRFCWLRDASFTVRTFYELGCYEEADSYVGWLLHATRMTHPRLNVLYDVFGETRLDEEEIDLEGYRQSRPVRTGNDAHAQVQLDVYGEVMQALEHRATRSPRAQLRLPVTAGSGRRSSGLWCPPGDFSQSMMPPDQPDHWN